MRRAGLRATAGAVLLLLTGCGIPVDGDPRPPRPGDVPFALPSTTRVPDPVGQGRVALYFVRDGQVVLSTRAVRRSTPTPELLRLLFAGTAGDEAANGLTSAIPTTLTVEDVAVEGGTAVVTLAGPNDEVLRTQPIAYAQIVATLTPNRAEGVRFRLDGADLPVPRGDGSLSDAPLDRDDYAELVAVPPTAGPSPSA